MKKTVITILCLFMISALIAGCGASHPGSGNEEAMAIRSELSGEWTQITEDGTPSLPEMGIPSGYFFYLNGTGLDTFWDMTFTYSADGNKMHIAYDDGLGEEWDYLYEVKGDKLTMTRADDNAITMIYRRVPDETETQAETEAETEAATEAETEAEPDGE